MIKSLESIKQFGQSSFLKRLGEWHSNNMGYKQMGLVYDDLIPDDQPVTREALRRLSPQESQQRTFRLRRALMLSVKKMTLERDEWTREDTPYLTPLLNLVEQESLTAEKFDSGEIPQALLKRNRA